MPVFLNHSFLEGIATRGSSIEALELLQHARQRLEENLLVHPDLSNVETGAGPFVAWANRVRSTPFASLAELLLRMCSGPFLQLENADPLGVAPSIAHLASWLQDGVASLLDQHEGELRAIVSPLPTGGLDEPRYSSPTRYADNWRSRAEVDTSITTLNGGRSTLEVLDEAAGQVPGLVVLPSARRSAKNWSRDCTAELLHRALLGLTAYANELARQLPDGTRPSREEAAHVYYLATGIEMSRETGDVSRKPSRKAARMFTAGRHGQQFFDMHAKPGARTRVHVWVHIDPAEPHARPEIYVGSCGEHLD